MEAYKEAYKDRTRLIAEYLRGVFPQKRYNPTPIEQDDNHAPSGTEDYPGRVVAFHITDASREFRITVEDVTLSE